jgi:hypothetical protein
MPRLGNLVISTRCMSATSVKKSYSTQLTTGDISRVIKSVLSDLLHWYRRILLMSWILGGGHLALMCMKLWGDHGTVADLPGAHLLHMAGQGLDTVIWNLCNAEAPSTGQYDFFFF